jgi:hypothetical protein
MSLGEALAQRLERPFGGGVARHGRRRIATCDRGNVDDGSAPALAHAGNHFLDAAQRAEVIGFHHLAKRRDRRLLDRAAARNASVVDEHVDWAMARGDRREGLPDRGVVVDVERVYIDGELLLSGDFAQIPRAVEIAHCRGNHMSRPSERHRSRKSNAAACSRDQSR